MIAARTLYENALEVTKDFLGPAAERFIARQIVFHLNKLPEQLSKEDIPKLAEWVKVSLALLTDNKEMVDDFARRILDLAK
jgi:hypothetical protein